MRIVILSNPPDFSAYLSEMLKTWGLALYEGVNPDVLPALDPMDAPVVICPASEGVRRYAASLIAYARRGGTVICFLPEGALARAAGLENEGEKELPLRLRITAYPAKGLAGELLPVVGHVQTYQHASEVQVLAYLSHPGRYQGESVGITETRVGHGRIVAFAFDLALCVLLLRQGDPSRAEVLSSNAPYARTEQLAADIGPNDSGWIPFADLLSRLFVDLVRRGLQAPTPLLSHLPGTAGGMLLYSGDDDRAEAAWNDEEMDVVAAAGGRMNLYIIPIRTKSTTVDVQRYLSRHDVGPHPDIRALDGHSVTERLAEFERQIRMFQEMFHVPARSLRNHCAAWAGYLEPVEIMERVGVRMDASYISGTYLRNRDYAPYAGFGAAMPMRFCRPDGRLINVFQQHTHLADDEMFSRREYSYKFSLELFEVMLHRILTDSVTRFHTPYTVNFHPGNFVEFSGAQGQELLRQAAEQSLPVWSFDQWLTFWEARDTWRFSALTWDGARLQFILAGSTSHDGLCFMVPANYAGTSLDEVRLDGEITDWQQETRYGENMVLVPIPAEKQRISVSVRYS
ncbi:hypothetical protein ES703_94866 [subsurface metagenome]